MAPTLDFALRLPRRGRSTYPPTKRSLGDKLQEIAHRSPVDLYAMETLADHVLKRLDERDDEAPRRGQR